MTRDQSIQGRCLCGGVRFSITGPIAELSSCHCSECRKAYGAAYGTVAVVAREDFSYTTGEERIRRYRQSERVNRYFCSDCGSPLAMIEEWDPLVGVPAGLLEGDPGIRMTNHIFVASKPDWSEIGDSAPQHDEWPPGEDMNERAGNLKQR